MKRGGVFRVVVVLLLEGEGDRNGEEEEGVVERAWSV